MRQRILSRRIERWICQEPKPGNLTDFFDFSSATPPKSKLILATRTCSPLNAAQKAYIATWNDD